MKDIMTETKVSSAFTPYQKFIVAVLAFLQFTIILDFMVLSPLGAILMPALQISPSQFGLLVSVYAFSAGASGILAAGFADRFDRKKLLLFFYTGFVLGTFLCAIAPSYHFLLFSRMITGFFGGVIGSVVFAITTDIFSFQMRGRVMGVIQTAFAASQIFGLPLGLFLANHWGWHMPFFLIVAVSVGVGVMIWRKMEPIDAHLKLRPDKNAFHHLIQTISTPRYLQAFATTAFMSTGGFMLMPFSSAFMLHNMGISLDKIPFLYFTTGVSAIIAGPMVGRISDRVGKFKVYVFGSLLTIAMVLIYTNLGVTSLAVAMVVNAVMFTGMFSRMIPAQTLMSAIPAMESRGSFMAVNSSIQQVSGGFASILAGFIVLQGVDGHLERFNLLGYCVVFAVSVTIVMMYFINKKVSA